ncbi:MAG: hypothetical protein AB4352_21235 [Hormoscilla sp.]
MQLQRRNAKTDLIHVREENDSDTLIMRGHGPWMPGRNFNPNVGTYYDANLFVMHVEENGQHKFMARLDQDGNAPMGSGGTSPSVWGVLSIWNDQGQLVFQQGLLNDSPTGFVPPGAYVFHATYEIPGQPNTRRFAEFEAALI